MLETWRIRKGDRVVVNINVPRQLMVAVLYVRKRLFMFRML